MGGQGSGRHWYHGAAHCVDDYRQLDVRRWQREGFLRPGRTYSWHWKRGSQTTGFINVRTEPDQVILSYRYRSGGGDWKDAEYPVRLDWTACAYGGRRAWFLCPSAGCGRRVAILYGGAIFACRHCYRLVYRSQRETDYDRAMRRADKIRARLGWESDFFVGEGDKPKGMRWRTYERLCDEQAVFANKSLSMLVPRLGNPKDPPD